jgi:hypothetical protein
MNETGSTTCRSIRSSSGPLSRARYCRTRSVEHVQRRDRSPAKLHGQGFTAATSSGRAGNVTRERTRQIATCPSSSGWHRTSRTIA